MASPRDHPHAHAGSRSSSDDDTADPADAPAAPTRDKLRNPMDIVHRILWDEHLNKADFTVGYLDRFDGVVERAFDEFDWTDITSDFAIPKHRIQYFKYKELKVWDRPARIDNVFGGRENPTTILAVIADYDQLLEQQRLAEHQRHQAPPQQQQEAHGRPRARSRSR